MTANEITKSVDVRIRPLVKEQAESCILMAKKLREQRKKIKTADMVVEYDNGGGQTGVRENPEFIAYEKMLATFNKTVSALIAEIGEGHQAEVSSLEEMRSRLRMAK